MDSRPNSWLYLFSLAAGILLAACQARPSTPPTPLILPDSFQATVVEEGLSGPTQMIAGPDGWLWLAQLNGAEEDGQGQVIALSLETGERRVLLENLFKPTGIAVAGGYLWVAAGRDLLRAPLDTNNRPGSPETVLEDLPFNGRSNGTLTVTPNGFLLYETSGQRVGREAAPGSAVLWALDTSNPTAPRPLAVGLKNAYAHTLDTSGRLWITDVADDPVNGKAPPDELNVIMDWTDSSIPDFGWPACFGFQQPAVNYGGTEAGCQATQTAVALFPPHATPTSVVVSPWHPETLLIALWNQGEVVQVKIQADGAQSSGQVEPFISGFQNPQHLLNWSDGTLLMSDHSSGTLYRVTHP
ncbi:MAG: glucose sorbosone dehydrogenase [Chloroflexota bacterium]